MSTGTTASPDESLQTWLRGLPLFPAELPTLDRARIPRDPEVLFLRLLHDAVAAGQTAAAVMTLSTVDESGAPDARSVLLRGIDEHGWQFATHASSPTGIQLAGQPRAAGTFFWPSRARQVRLSGLAQPRERAESDFDFLSRPLASRAATLVGRQSETIEDGDDVGRAFANARRALVEAPDTVDEDWTLYSLKPDRIEFWQGSHDREATRLLYRRADEGWTTEYLWP